MTKQLRTNDPFELFDAIFNDLACSNLYDYVAPAFPPTNVYVEKDTKDLMFEFAIAGYSAEDADVTFEGDKMTFSLEAKETEKEGYSLLHKGIKTSKSAVTYVVPVSKYKTEEAEAKLENGILTIKIPALEAIKPKKLLIK